MQERPEIWYVGHEKAKDEVSGHVEGGQDQVNVPQVTLIGHGDEIETLNLGCRDKIPDQCLSKKYCARAMSLAFGVCHEFRDMST